MKECRGDNQVDEKKGKTCMRRSSTGKKEGKPAYFGAYVTRTRFMKAGLRKE
jgi:hypothetical protein